MKHLRDLVHQGCPAVEETIKWSMPAFVYKGLLCMMAAFKHHATLHFWRHELVVGRIGQKQAMGEFGRITCLQDLPRNKLLLGYIRKAVELNEAGIKPRTRSGQKPAEKRELSLPRDLGAALKKHKGAHRNFERFSYTHKKEYVEWLGEAKRKETRQQRLQTAVVWIAQGKSRNWKYTQC